MVPSFKKREFIIPNPFQPPLIRGGAIQVLRLRIRLLVVLFLSLHAPGILRDMLSGLRRLAGQTFAFGIEDFEMAHAAFSHGIFHGGLYHSDPISHATAKADG